MEGEFSRESHSRAPEGGAGRIRLAHLRPRRIPGDRRGTDEVLHRPGSVAAMLGIEHDEVEAGGTDDFDKRRASGEALNAEQNRFLLKYR